MAAAQSVKIDGVGNWGSPEKAKGVRRAADLINAYRTKHNDPS